MPLDYSLGVWVNKEISKLPGIMVGFIEKLGGDTLEANPMSSYFVEYTRFCITPATPQPWHQGVRILLKLASTDRSLLSQPVLRQVLPSTDRASYRYPHEYRPPL